MHEKEIDELIERYKTSDIGYRGIVKLFRALLQTGRIDEMPEDYQRQARLLIASGLIDLDLDDEE